MTDTITGIAVLQPTWVPGIYRMTMTETRATGRSNANNIFIKDEAVPGLPEKFPGYPDGCNTIWKFKRRGNFLDCHPSVNDITGKFHNAGAWSVEYVEMIQAEKPYDPDSNDNALFVGGGRIHQEINCGTRQDAEERIAELKQQQILK